MAINPTYTLVVLFAETGLAVTVIVKATDTIITVKNKLQMLTNVPDALGFRLVFMGGEAQDGERLDDLGVVPGMGMQAISHGSPVRVFSADLSTHIDVVTSDTVADVTSAILVRKPNAAGITLLWHENHPRHPLLMPAPWSR
jgi:hypothetical protein